MARQYMDEIHVESGIQHRVLNNLHITSENAWNEWEQRAPKMSGCTMYVKVNQKAAYG